MRGCYMKIAHNARRGHVRAMLTFPINLEVFAVHQVPKTVRVAREESKMTV